MNSWESPRVDPGPANLNMLEKNKEIPGELLNETSIIVCTVDRLTDLEACLKSLLPFRARIADIIVVNNGPLLAAVPTHPQQLPVELDPANFQVVGERGRAVHRDPWTNCAIYGDGKRAHARSDQPICHLDGE